MNVLINAITITEGGGVVVLSRLLEFMHQANPTVTWYIAAGPSILSCLPVSNKIIGISYSWARKSPLHLLYWYEIELPRLISRVEANLCFSHTNFLSRHHLSCASLLLFHNAGFFSDLFTTLQLKCYTSFKDAFIWKQKIKWAFSSLKRATAITVQTKVLADKIVERLNVNPEKIFIIPHGLGLLNNVTTETRFFPSNSCWRIGYITKFGVQKDFDTAIKAISQLKKKKLPIKFVLTLNQDIREYPPILEQIRRYEIEDMVENLGDITDPEEIKNIYESLHLFIFPSIIESFGFTLVEAMASGLPVIIADTDSNREVADFAGHFFRLGDATDLANSIIHLMNEKELYIRSSKNSLDRARQFCWQKTAQSLLRVIQQMATRSY